MKRDLRSQNHEPLNCAEKFDIPYIIAYIFEPRLIQHHDTSLRHLQFIYNSILELNKTLRKKERSVHVFYGEAENIFQFLMNEFEVKNVFSYQESGVQISWERDQLISNMLKEEGVSWKEFQRDGIIRGIKNRNQWRKK